jgi:hypothetical protein
MKRYQVKLRYEFGEQLQLTGYVSSLFDAFFCYMQWLENFVDASMDEVGMPQ